METSGHKLQAARSNVTTPFSHIPGPEGPRRLPAEAGTPTGRSVSVNRHAGVPPSGGSRVGALAPSLASLWVTHRSTHSACAFRGPLWPTDYVPSGPCGQSPSAVHFGKARPGVSRRGWGGAYAEARRAMAGDHRARREVLRGQPAQTAGSRYRRRGRAAGTCRPPARGRFSVRVGVAERARYRRIRIMAGGGAAR